LGHVHHPLAILTRRHAVGDLKALSRSLTVLGRKALLVRP
jgi:hypothetical protein